MKKEIIEMLRTHTQDGKMITDKELDEIEVSISESCEHDWQIVNKIRAGKIYTIVSWCSKCAEAKSKPVKIYQTGDKI